MTVGEKIRKLRIERDWTQKELGAVTGLGNNVSSYENGHLKPSLKTLKKFADAFEMTVEELAAVDVKAPAQEFRDPELLTLLRDLNALPEAEIQKAKWFLSLLVKQHRLQQMIAS